MKRILFVLILSLSNVVFGQQPVTDLGFAGTSIITDGLILHLDAGNTDSYSGSGNTWNDISGNSNDVQYKGMQVLTAPISFSTQGPMVFLIEVLGIAFLQAILIIRWKFISINLNGEMLMDLFQLVRSNLEINQMRSGRWEVVIDLGTTGGVMI